MSVSCPRCGAKPIRICFRDQSFELREGEIKEFSLPQVEEKESPTTGNSIMCEE
jgi:hypothetical protein